VPFSEERAAREDPTVPDAKTSLLVLLGLFGAIFSMAWFLELSRRNKWREPTGFHLFVGCITNFFDTLGIGSYATTTSLYRPRHTVADENIPGTLTVGHTIPTIAQAFIYITVIEVEMRTLTLMIAVSVLGAWLGAEVVTRLPRRRIQIGMGVALLAAATLILARLLEFLPKGGDALGLEGSLLVAALVGNFVLGALMTIGIGAYAPIMIMVSLLGMSPKTAFPIMMGSCAFLMPVAGIRFIRANKYDAQAALGLTAAGVPAVLLAAFIVWELPLDVVRWLVVVVVVYTAVSMLLSARRERRETQAKDGENDRTRTREA
jgi:uncharacterized membrane protein YfcA